MSKKSNTQRTETRSLLVHVTGDRIGDALIKLPALRAFRAACPGTRITWVTARRPSAFAGALAPLSAGLIDTCHECTGIGLDLFARLPEYLASGFDVVLSTETRLRDTLVLRRVPHTRFISPALRFALSDARPASAYRASTGFERFASLMSLAAGKDLLPDATIELPENFDRAAAILLPAGPDYVGLSPGAGGARKRWPLDRFVALAGILAAGGQVPVFFLGPDEAPLASGLREQVPGARFPEADGPAHGAKGPLLTIALARRLRCAVGNDSGGGHLLAAGGQPVITLFGHTDPGKFKPPYGSRVAIIASDFDGRDVARIPVEAVAAAVRGLVRGPR